jgi:hypothetical protein
MTHDGTTLLNDTLRLPEDERLEPADEWSPEFLEVLGSVSEEIERPRSRTITEMKDPFA